jgi:hypothetical protein
MISSQPVKFNDLSVLSDQEEKILAAILNKLKSGSVKDSERAQVIQYIADYPVDLLYKLSVKNSSVNDLLESNEYLNKAWASMLKDLGYPYHPITSVDGKVTLSLFQQLKGAYLLSEFQKNPDFRNFNSASILNKACEIGMFQALILRLNNLSESIARNNGDKADPDRIDTNIRQILQDAQKLSNLYWSIGSLNAAQNLFKVTNYFFKKEEHTSTIERFFLPAKANKFSWSGKYNDKDSPYALEALKCAMELLHSAEILFEFPESKKITEEVTGGKGIFYGHEDTFSNALELRKLVMKKLDELQIPLPTTFSEEALNQAKNDLARNNLSPGKRK